MKVYAGLIPEPGRQPEVGNGNPLQYSCLENSMGRGAWQAIVPAVAKSQRGLSRHTRESLRCFWLWRLYASFPARDPERAHWPLAQWQYTPSYCSVSQKLDFYAFMYIQSLGFYFFVLGFLDLEKINICFKRMFSSNVHITTNKNNNVDINKYDLYFERGLTSHRNELMQVLRICNRAVNNMHFHKFALQHFLFFNLFIFSFPQ